MTIIWDLFVSFLFFYFEFFLEAREKEKLENAIIYERQKVLETAIPCWKVFALFSPLKICFQKLKRV